MITEEKAVVAPPEPKKAAAGPGYTVAEIIANARTIFEGKTSRSAVTAALRLDGKERYTTDQAKQVVSDFLKKGVE